jgi:hypothetical protein
MSKHYSKVPEVAYVNLKIMNKQSPKNKTLKLKNTVLFNSDKRSKSAKKQHPARNHSGNSKLDS